MSRVETDRLILRAPVETDRRRFVELFTNEAFTVFSDGVHDVESANARFERMVEMAEVIPYAKQPLVERATGAIVGYTGVDTAVIDGIDRLEWGWRLAPDARGRGYATEAATALLAVADAHDDGEMLCIIAADNHASRRVADKVGFRWWQRINWDGDPAEPTDLLVRSIGAGGPPLVAPVGDWRPAESRALPDSATPAARAELAGGPDRVSAAEMGVGDTRRTAGGRTRSATRSLTEADLRPSDGITGR